MCLYLSVHKITCTFPELPTIFAIRSSPASTCVFSFFVTVVCLPVYSTSILLTSSLQQKILLGSAHTTLVRTRNLHIFTVLRDRPSCHLDPLPLQFRSQLIIGQRLPLLPALHPLLPLSFQQHQRQVSALWSVHSFGEEEAKLIHSL